jgi:signal peptidase I
LSRLASLLSSAILLILLLLFILTVLARMGVFSFLGVAVVYSGSMEPSINRWDLVVWANKDYSRGDVVLCCLSRTFCYTHRYIDDCPGGTCIITKGDANPAPDSVPVSRDMVRGAVIAVVPRELWIPLFLFAVAVPLLSIARTPVIGLSFSLTILTVFFFVFTVYGLTQPPIQPTDIEPPILYLSKSYFDEGSCSFVIYREPRANGGVWVRQQRFLDNALQRHAHHSAPAGGVAGRYIWGVRQRGNSG